MTLEVNSYLNYEVDEDAKICISISNLYDIIQKTREHLWEAAQDSQSDENGIYEFGRILDSIIVGCIQASGDITLTPIGLGENDADANNNIKGDSKEGATWLDHA